MAPLCSIHLSLCYPASYLAKTKFSGDKLQLLRTTSSANPKMGVAPPPNLLKLVDLPLLSDDCKLDCETLAYENAEK